MTSPIYNNYQKYPTKAGSQDIQESPEAAKKKTYFNFNRGHVVFQIFTYCHLQKLNRIYQLEEKNVQDEIIIICYYSLLYYNTALIHYWHTFHILAILCSNLLGINLK